jgi:uncharacterized repeat protein (TIGR01451 family)
VVAGLISSLFVLVPSPAGAAEPQHVSFTLEGCDQDMTFTLPNASGKFICPDARYGTGNLGKNWNELDLVPFRFTADAGNAAPATQNYDIGIAVDREDVGRPGYDVLSEPVRNTALSSASGCGSLSVGSAFEKVPGFGGIDKSLARKLTITGQAKNTTCVYDFYARLALGSHLFPGSSLHANITDEEFVGTNQDRSIPVNEILPQELRKDMAATQGSDHIWNISKEATPVTLNFEDTCAPGSGSRSAPVSVTVRWERLAATPSGDINVVTNIYAKNPASRLITVNVSDAIRSGTTVLDTASSGAIDVPANTEMLVFTHQFTVPAGTTNLNDVATATYTDKVTGIAVPGTTIATASAAVQPSGVVTNSTATITDVESITGANLEFSVESVTGASGSFGGGYTLGTRLAAGTPVSWTSASQSGNGSVTFAKTVYVTGPSVTSGTLSDTATLTGSNSFSASAQASTAITASASVSLTVNKQVPDVLQNSESVTFGFKVWTAGSNPATGTPVRTTSITFTAGQTAKSATVSGLDPGVYFVTEDPAAGWNTQPASGLVDLSVGQDGRVTCSGSVSFTNSFRPASAEVVKVTDPAGFEDGWTMCLSGPGIEGQECVVTANGGKASFEADLSEGSFTITEQEKAGWRPESSNGCSFIVDYPADQSRIFTCTFHNEKLGRIIIEKMTDPPNEDASFDFTLKGGPSNLDRLFSLGDGDEYDSGYVQAGSGYVAAETVPAGWDQSLVSCDDNDSTVGNIRVAPGEEVTCSFVNTERGLIVIKKVTDPQGAEQSFDFTLEGGPSDLSDAFTLTGGHSRQSGFVEPGDGYAAAETVPEGWDQTAASCDDGSPIEDIDVSPAEIVTCTFENTQRGAIVIEKVTNPAGATQSFEFDLQGGPSELGQSFSLIDGGSHESGLVKPGNGYAASETVPAGWDQTAASCNDGSPVGDIDVSPGEVVTCTFTNTQRGQIVIRKVTSPAGASQSFPFTLVGGPSAIDQSFSLTDGGSHESGFVKPGSGYSARENVPSDWTQTSATCDDGSVPSDISVSPNEVVTCTFTNTAKPNGISLDKKVNGGDHASAGDALLSHTGDPLTYTVVITNTGQVPLTLTALTDSLYAGFAASCPQGVGSVLAAGASVTCTYRMSAVDDAHNVAAVDAVDSLNRPVTDSDDTFVDVIHPAITIVKTASPEFVSVSGPVTYTYVVTNTGDTALFNVSVTDDILGAIGTIGQLLPGESVTMAKTVQVDASTPPRNIGTAVGTDVLGQSVSATDDAVITVVLALELPRTGGPLQAETRAAIMLLEVGIFMSIAGRRRRTIRRAV